MAINNYLSKLSTVFEFKYKISDTIIDQSILDEIIRVKYSKENNILIIDYFINLNTTVIFTFDGNSNLSTVLRSIDIIELFHLYINDGEFLDQDIKEKINLSLQEHFRNILRPIINTKKEASAKVDHYSAEIHLFTQVKNGNREHLIILHNDFFEKYLLGTLSLTSSLQDDKYFLISVVTLSTRYAIEGGVPQRLAYSLSDMLIQELDSVNTSIDRNRFSLNILLAFCDEVIKDKRVGLSPLIIDIQNYIENKIYERITLNDISTRYNYSPNHLSKRFKEESSYTISAYINLQKIKEAKELIQFSNMSINEISNQLNFSDYSHFSKYSNSMKI